MCSQLILLHKLTVSFNGLHRVVCNERNIESTRVGDHVRTSEWRHNMSPQDYDIHQLNEDLPPGLTMPH